MRRRGDEAIPGTDERVARGGKEPSARLHNVTAELGQALADTGWTVPPSPAVYWVGEAMGSVDFKDLPNIPEIVEQSAAMGGEQRGASGGAAAGAALIPGGDLVIARSAATKQSSFGARRALPN